MNPKKTAALAWAAAIAIAVVGMVLVRQRNEEVAITRSSTIQPAAAPAKTTAALTPATAPPEIPAVETAAPVQTVPEKVSPVPRSSQSAKRAAPSSRAKEPIQDPDARAALGLVGEIGRAHV